jgi:hypothetical protein
MKYCLPKQSSNVACGYVHEEGGAQGGGGSRAGSNQRKQRGACLSTASGRVLWVLIKTVLKKVMTATEAQHSTGTVIHPHKFHDSIAQLGTVAPQPLLPLGVEGTGSGSVANTTMKLWYRQRHAVPQVQNSTCMQSAVCGQTVGVRRPWLLSKHGRVTDAQPRMQANSAPPWSPPGAPCLRPAVCSSAPCPPMWTMTQRRLECSTGKCDGSVTDAQPTISYILKE